MTEPDFTRSNRAHLARQQQWPPGAEDACNEIQRRWPLWHPVWVRGSDHQAAGFYARKRGDKDLGQPVYGVTAADLAEAIRRNEADRAEQAELDRALDRALGIGLWCTGNEWRDWIPGEGVTPGQ